MPFTSLSSGPVNNGSAVNGPGAPVAPKGAGRPSTQPRPLQVTGLANVHRDAAATVEPSQNKGEISPGYISLTYRLFSENESNVRRSERVPKGKTGVERLQLVSDLVSQPATKKRRGAPIEAIPDSTEPNPMAPAQEKTKRRRGNKVRCLVCIPDGWSDLVVGKAPVPTPALVNIPVPSRVPVHIVPPGTEPVLQNNAYQFGLSIPGPTQPDPAQAQHVVSRGQPAPQSNSRPSNAQLPSSAEAAVSSAYPHGRVSAQAPDRQINFVRGNPPVSHTPVSEAVSQP
jgi:hypothetical protein